MPKAFTRDELIRERQHIKDQLESQAESALGRALWRTRLESIDQKLSELTDESHPTASVALLFEGEPVLGTKEIRADFAAHILENFQNFVGVVFAQSAGQSLKEIGRVPMVERSRLYVREMARGSVGFVLEERENSQTEFIDTPLKAVVEKAVEIIERISLPEGQEDFLDGLSPRAVQSAHRLAETLMKAEATAKIFSEGREVRLSKDRVERLFHRLDEVRMTERVEDIPGVLLGILPESGRFELRLGSTEAILGGDTSIDIQWRYISDQTFHERFVMQRVIAKIRSIQIERAGRTQKRDYVLEDVREGDSPLEPA